MAAVIAGLKSVDFYRKLKKDLQQELTEASFAGAALVRYLCMNACMPIITSLDLIEE